MLAEAALAVVDRLGLDGYYLYHTIRGDLLRRVGQRDASRVAYGRALELCANPVERGFLERKVRG